MRRLPGLILVLGLLAAATPTAVSAAQPVRHADWQTQMICELPADAGFVSLFAEARPWGAGASIALWTPDQDPSTELPGIVSGATDAVLDGSRLRATIELVLPDDPEKSAGSARLDAELVAIGPEEDFGSRDLRDGNRLVRIEQTIQSLDVVGTLTLDLADGTHEEIDLEPCGASTFRTTVFATDPNAYLTNTEQVFLSCAWVTELGSVDLLAISDDFTNFSAVTVVGSERAFVGLAVPMLTATEYTAEYELFDPATGEVLGAATAGATLAPSGERITDHEWVDPHRFNVVGAALTANGTMSLTLEGQNLELPIDDVSCDGGDVRVQVMERIARS